LGTITGEFFDSIFDTVSQPALGPEDVLVSMEAARSDAMGSSAVRKES
jgi:hypothetical protein